MKDHETLNTAVMAEFFFFAFTGINNIFNYSKIDL